MEEGSRRSSNVVQCMWAPLRKVDTENGRHQSVVVGRFQTSSKKCRFSIPSTIITTHAVQGSALPLGTILHNGQIRDLSVAFFFQPYDSTTRTSSDHHVSFSTWCVPLRRLVRCFALGLVYMGILCEAMANRKTPKGVFLLTLYRIFFGRICWDVDFKQKPFAPRRGFLGILIMIPLCALLETCAPRDHL